MKILGIKKLYCDIKKLRCTLETDQDLDFTVEVDLTSTGKLNKKVMEELNTFSNNLLNIIEKDSL